MTTANIKPYTRAEVCELLHITNRTLNRYLLKHSMGQLKIGGRTVFSRPIIDKHLTTAQPFPVRKYKLG